MRFSIVGFIVGAAVALIGYAVATALITFRHSDLVFGVIAILIWAYLTFNWPGPGIGSGRRTPPAVGP